MRTAPTALIWLQNDKVISITVAIQGDTFKVSILIEDVNNFWLLSQLICDAKRAAALYDEQIQSMVKRVTALATGKALFHRSRGFADTFYHTADSIPA